MDPLSILTTILAVIETGTSLSTKLYRFIASIRNAPDEILGIAANITVLNSFLKTLHDVLRKSKGICNRLLLKEIHSAMERISEIHKDLKKLTGGHTVVGKFLWNYKKHDIQYKLGQIEGHKSTIQFMQTALLAVASERKETRLPKATTKTNSTKKEKKPQKNIRDTILLQQCEALTYPMRDCIVNLIIQQLPYTDESTMRLQGDNHIDNGEQNKLVKVRVMDKPPDDTPVWLYDLFFKSWAHSKHGSNSKGIDNSINSLAVTLRSPEGWHMAIYDSGASYAVVDTLLADWTTPDVIMQDPEMKQIPIQKALIDSETAKGKKQFITFKVCDQHFTLPFHLIHTWNEMEQKIKQALEHVDEPHPHAFKGPYTVVDRTGGIIMADCWTDTVAPGMLIELRKRPAPKNAGAKKPANSPPPTIKTTKPSRATTGNGPAAKPGGSSNQQGQAKTKRTPNQNKIKVNPEGSGAQAKKGKQPT